jgi:uncharacterized Zn finger protein (UPF0148 family)
MNSAGHWHCDECGPIPAMKRTPTHCPICGRKIEWIEIGSFEPQERAALKKFAASDERAAEWFKKMREAIN